MVRGIRREVQRLQAAAVLAPPTGIDWRDVPVLVNSFNRLGCLRRLIDWLRSAGHRTLIVIDNASSYPPLIDYLGQIERTRAAKVVRLDDNLGHLALWRENLLERLGIATEYVYTDPDVVPATFCPADAVGFLQHVLAEEPEVALAGLGLRLDDIPDHYGHKRCVLAWEEQFWLRPAAPRLFHAPIDTTFALYRPGAGHGLRQPALRTGWPYLAAHEGWYVDQRDWSEEDCFYHRATLPETSHWSVPEVPAWLRAAAADCAARRPVLLHLAADDPAIPGYLRFPLPERSADAGITLPLEPCALDGIYCACGLERLADPLPLLRELRRAAKPGARMVVRLPYTAADGAADHPHHVRRHLRALLAAFGVTEPRRGDNRRRSGWRVERLVLIADRSRRTSAARDPHALLSERQPLPDELVLHLRAGGPDDPPAPVAAELSFSRLDHWEGFARV
jgi:SAM-dependent methyltransferase